MQKYKRNIVIIVIVALGIIWLRFYSPMAKKAFSTPPLSESECEYLKNIVLEFAKGNEPLLDDGIAIEHELTDTAFEVNIYQRDTSEKVACRLKVVFPITEVNVELTDGIIKRNFSVEYDKGEYNYYENKSKDEFIANCLVVTIIAIVTLSTMLYFSTIGSTDNKTTKDEFKIQYIK